MAGYEEATDKQIRFIRGLAEEVRTNRELLESGKLNRGQAGAVIDTLLDVLGRGNGSTLTKLEKELPKTDLTEMFNDVAEEQEPEKEPWQILQEELNYRYGAAFSGLTHYMHYKTVGGERRLSHREPSREDYHGKPIVYQRWPHSASVWWKDMSVRQYWGWGWICFHEDHQRRGKATPVRGGSRLGWEVTLRNAIWHAYTKHGDGIGMVR